MSIMLMEKKNTKDNEKFEFRYKRRTDSENKKETYDVLKEIEKKYGKISKSKNEK